jgi:hypothetical protein
MIEKASCLQKKKGLTGLLPIRPSNEVRKILNYQLIKRQPYWLILTTALQR